MPKHITNILEDSDDPLFTIVNKIFMVTLRSRKKTCADLSGARFR